MLFLCAQEEGSNLPFGCHKFVIHSNQIGLILGRTIKMSRKLLLLIEDDAIQVAVDLFGRRNSLPDIDVGLLTNTSSQPAIAMNLYLEGDGADYYRRTLFDSRELKIAVLGQTSLPQDEPTLVIVGRLVVSDHAPAAKPDAGSEPLLDRASFRVMLDGRWLRLNPMDFELLEYFVANPERVIPRSEFIATLWTHDRHVRERSVDVRVKRLRKALGDRGLIRTQRSVGYFLTRDKSPLS